MLCTRLLVRFADLRLPPQQVDSDALLAASSAGVPALAVRVLVRAPRNRDVVIPCLHVINNLSWAGAHLLNIKSMVDAGGIAALSAVASAFPEVRVAESER